MSVLLEEIQRGFHREAPVKLRVEEKKGTKQIEPEEAAQKMSDGKAFSSIFHHSSLLSSLSASDNSGGEIVFFVLGKVVLLHFSFVLFYGHLKYFKHVAAVDYVL